MKLSAMALITLLLLASAAPARADTAVNSLTWRVADDNAVFGYIIYRADRREGPFRRISQNIVRSQRGVASAGSYRFDDQNVEIGKTYYYFIDAISEHGRKQRLSGVRAKTASGGLKP